MSIKEGAIVKSKTNRYKIQKLLGKGIQGEVYQASDSAGNVRALKFVSLLGPSSDPHPDKEIEIYERISKIKDYNKYVPTYYESFNYNQISVSRKVPKIDRYIYENFGLENKYKVLVLELVKGKTVADIIINRPISLSQDFEIFGKTLEPIKFLIDNNICHNAIHTSNIMWNEKDKSVRILDLGHAEFKPKECFDFNSIAILFSFVFSSEKIPAFSIPDYTIPIRTKLDVRNWWTDLDVADAIASISHLFTTDYLSEILKDNADYNIITRFDIDRAMEIFNKTKSDPRSSTSHYDVNRVELTSFTPKDEDIGFEYLSIYETNFKHLLKELGSSRTISSLAVLYIQKLMEPFINDLVDLTPEGEGILTDYIISGMRRRKYKNLLNIITRYGMDKLKYIGNLPPMISGILFLSIYGDGSLRNGLDYLILEILKGADHRAYINYDDNKITIWDVIMFISNDPDFSSLFGEQIIDAKFISPSGVLENFRLPVSEELFYGIVSQADNNRLSIFIEMYDGSIRLSNEGYERYMNPDNPFKYTADVTINNEIVIVNFNTEDFVKGINMWSTWNYQPVE